MSARARRVSGASCRLRGFYRASSHSRSRRVSRKEIDLGCAEGQDAYRQGAARGHRQGEAGAAIDGSKRDPDASRGIGYPIWCRGITPITGKWRTQTVAINGSVHIVGVQVRAGDLVAADEAGVCFVSQQHAAAVLEAARRIDAGDARRKQAIAQGAAVAELAQKKFS